MKKLPIILTTVTLGVGVYAHHLPLVQATSGVEAAGQGKSTMQSEESEPEGSARLGDPEIEVDLALLGLKTEEVRQLRTDWQEVQEKYSSYSSMSLKMRKLDEIAARVKTLRIELAEIHGGLDLFKEANTIRTEMAQFCVGHGVYARDMGAEDLVQIDEREETENQPLEPTDPTNPTEPTEPTDPVNPTDPTEPTEPSNPTKPVEPSQPTDPTDPSQPITPTEPVKPSEPVRPVTPAEPGQSGSMTEEDQPAQPDKDGNTNQDPTGANQAGVGSQGALVAQGPAEGSYGLLGGSGEGLESQDAAGVGDEAKGSEKSDSEATEAKNEELWVKNEVEVPNLGTAQQGWKWLWLLVPGALLVLIAIAVRRWQQRS